MPASIKVLAPERLPEGELTEQDFQTYQTELEVYLYLNEKFHPPVLKINYHGYHGRGTKGNWGDQRV